MSHLQAKATGPYSKGRPASHRQAGFTLIEIMIAIVFIGVAATLVLWYETRANTSQSANNASAGSILLAGKIKQYFGPANSFTAVSATKVNEMGIVPKGMSFDGTNLLDPWGNTMSVNGGTTTFAITMGGATMPLDKEACTSLASKLADSAQAIRIGAATAAAGVVAGGSAYKAVGGAPDPALLGTGCATANAVIAVQFIR